MIAEYLPITQTLIEQFCAAMPEKDSTTEPIFPDPNLESILQTQPFHPLSLAVDKNQSPNVLGILDVNKIAYISKWTIAECSGQAFPDSKLSCASRTAGGIPSFQP